MFWKILFFIYTAFTFSLFFTGINQVHNINTFSIMDETVTIFAVIFWLFAMTYTYALGWKKQLVDKVYNKYILIGGIVALIISGIYFFMSLYPSAYDELIRYAMKQGMAPRNWDFQFVLLITRTMITILTIVYLFLIYAPFFVGYYFYGKNMYKFSAVKFAGRKIFTCFMFINFLPVILLYIFGVSSAFANYNVYDFLTILYMGLTLTGLYGYAFNIKIYNKNFWMAQVPLIALLALIPDKLLSPDFLRITGGPCNFNSSPLLTISDWAMLIGALYMIYKYAYTNMVFNNCITLPNKNADENTSDSI